MPPQGKTSPFKTWMHTIKPILRALTTPTPRFYPNMTLEVLYKIRTLHLSLIVLAILSFFVSIAMSLSELSSNGYVTRNLVLSGFWIFALIGYILSWRGMWRFVMSAASVVIILFITAEAISVGHAGTRVLYYLVFVVAWTSYYFNWRAWIILMLGTFASIMVYTTTAPPHLSFSAIVSLLVFFTVTYGVLILVRIYRENTTAQFIHQLSTSEAYLRTTIEASDDGFYLLRAVFDDTQRLTDFRIIEVNEAACKQLGMTRGQLINGLICDLFPINKTGGFFEQYKEVYQTGEKMEQEYFVPEGRIGSGWYYQQVVKVADGLVIMNRNINQRKQFELDLVRRQNRLQSLLESQSAYVIRTDNEGNYTYANQRFLDQFGYEKKDILGKNSLESIYSEDHLTTFEAVQACYQTPGQPIPLSIRKIRSDGKILWTDWEFTALVDNIGDVSEIQCIGLDATARMDAEKARHEAQELRLQLKQQEELNQIKMRMMTRISHEFRTPLSIIRSSTNLLERYSNRMTEDGRVEKLIHINDEIDRLTKMIEDMGRILKGDFEQPIVMEQCDLPTLIRKIVARHQSTETHPIVAKIQPEFPSILADESLLDVIINNLLSNAIKFSAKSSTIAISTQYTDTHFSIVVIDNGIGILPSEIKQIYDPFFRGTNFDEIGGMGLGLSLVKNAVQAHHGTIEVVSEVGVGTTFTVTIPR